VLIFNALARARAMAHEGWSAVEVQLQRRADLVPGLVLVVAAHAGHERSVLREVATQRSAALVADR
jgi:LemA protein